MKVDEITEVFTVQKVLSIILITRTATNVLEHKYISIYNILSLIKTKTKQNYVPIKHKNISLCHFYSK